MEKFSEIILLTHSQYYYDIKEWLEHHIKLGFDHITVYDNDSPADIENLCKNYPNISYYKIPGWPNQMALELEHYRKSEYKWVYFGDDDEFLWIDSNKYTNINDFIQNKSEEFECDNIAIYWVKPFAIPAIEHRIDSPETTQQKTFKYVSDVEPETWTKCFYRTGQLIQKMGCHNCWPIGKTYDVKGHKFKIENVRLFNYDYKNDDCLIYHYFFRSWDEFNRKMQKSGDAVYTQKPYTVNITSYNSYLKLLYNNSKIGYSYQLYCILIVKTDNVEDFKLWVNWYIKFIKCDQIYIVNDSSEIDIQNIVQPYKNQIKVINKAELIDRQDINDEQTYCYNKLIAEYIKPNIDDFIIIPDLDELWWYDYNKFDCFKNCIDAEFKYNKNYNSLLFAEILMSTNNYIYNETRKENFALFSRYHTTMITCEHKPIIKYNQTPILSYHLGVKYYKAMGSILVWEDYLGCYVLYDYHLRLYHYRLTTQEEFSKKFSNSLVKNEIIDGKRYFIKDNDIASFMQKVYYNQSADTLLYNMLDTTVVDTIEKFL